MELTRKEAIILSSFFSFLNLTQEERLNKIEIALSEHGLEMDEVTSEKSNSYARKYIELKFSYFSNSYLELFLNRQVGKIIAVKGKRRELISCPCCCYKTLDTRGDYDICKVCYWEDDGNDDLNAYSQVNRMALIAAKENFRKFGVSDEGFLDLVDPDRMIQYKK